MSKNLHQQLFINEIQAILIPVSLMERKLGESSLFLSRSLHWLMLSNRRYVSPTVNKFVRHLAIRFLTKKNNDIID